MADPISGTVLLILLAVQAGAMAAQYALAPKAPKQAPLDKGRLDDLRFQTVEEGGTKIKVYGRRVRVSGNVIDGSRTREIKSTTPGRSGGKAGGGRPAEPTTNNFSYKKTFAIAVCQGPIRSFLQIKEDDEVVFNMPASYLPAERSGNTLAGGAAVAVDATCAGGRKVNLPNTGSVQWNTVPIAVVGTVSLVIYYQANASISATVRVNSTDHPVTLPSTSGALGEYSLAVSMNLGNNTVKITNGTASTLSIDQIFAFPDLIDDVTGVIHPTDPYPSDLDSPGRYYNFAPARNPRGEVTGTFANGGQSPFELYLGTETQLQSPALVAIHGAGATSAHRGVAYMVADQYSLKGPRLSNFTFEIEPDIQDLGACMADMYLDRGSLPEEFDFSALDGIPIIEGFIVDRRAPLSDYVDSLQAWFNFDVVPIGGKVVAVPRGGASSFSIPENKMTAHEEGEERPQAAVTVDHVEGTDIPVSADVLYLDVAASKEFHGGTQHYTREVGNSVDPATYTFPIVSDKDTAHAVAKRLVYENVLKGKPLGFVTGPEFRYLTPTDVGTLVLSDRTWRARLVGKQAGFNGMIKWRAIPEKAALSTQTGVGAVGTGSESPAVAFPPNTFLALMDLPPLRLEDDALGYYVAVCPRGQAETLTGKWQGAHLFKEELTGQYDRITGFDRAATMGVLTNALAPITDTLSIDRTTQLVIDLLHDDGVIASITEDEMLSRPVNEMVRGSGATAEVLRFATVTPQAATAPYVARYLLTNLLRGLNGTETAARAGADSGATVVLLNDAVKFRREDPAELRRARNFKAISVGQAQANAAIVPFTFEGYSKKHLSPTNIRGYNDTAGNRFIEWVRRARQAGVILPILGVPLLDEEELYRVAIFDGATLKHEIWVRNPTGAPVPWHRVQILDPEFFPDEVRYRSDIRLDPYNSFFEATVDSHADAAGIGVLKICSGDYETTWWQILFAYSAPPNAFIVQEWDPTSGFVTKYSSPTLDPTLDPDNGYPMRPRFQILNGELLVYEQYVNDGSVVAYRSGKRPSEIGPLAIEYLIPPPDTNIATVTDAIAGIGRPQCVYPVDLQTAHFGGPVPLGDLEITVTQYSSLVGPGIPASALV